MADYLRTVEYLRDIRTAPVTAASDELRQAAAEYAQLCTQANERLRRCTTLLQQGLRSEALQLSNEEPNLLDLVAALDLPDASVWADICQQFDLPLPPPLQLDRAALINDAVNGAPSLEELLTRHRHLALERAPIRERLAVMRQVAQIDGTSSFWDKDIRAAERARIKEMRLECQAAVRDNDAAGISELAGEVEKGDWREPIPPDLQKAVGDAFGMMMKSEVEGKLHGILQRLHSAFAAKNYDECRDLVQQSKQILEATGVDHVSTPIVNQFQPVTQWLQKEGELRARNQAFISACGNFQAMLDGGAPTDQLSQAYATLGQYGNDVPENLTARYSQLVSGRSRSIGRKRLIRFGLGLLAAAVVFAIVYFILLYSDASKEAEAIRKAVKDKDLTHARYLVESQERRSPFLSHFPPLQAAKAEVESLARELKRDEESGAEKASQAEATVKALMEQEVTPGKAQANAVLGSGQSDPAAYLSAARQITGLVAKLEDAAKLDGLAAEKRDALANEAAQIKQLQGKLAAKAVELVSAQAQALSQQIDAISTSATTAQTGASLDAIAAKLSALVALADLPAETKSVLTGLNARIDRKRQDMGHSRDVQRALEALRSHPPTADGLKDQLTAFATQFANEPVSRDFAKAAEHLSTARSVEAWAAMVGQWKSFAATSSADAAARQVAVSSYATTKPAQPMSAEATDYAAYLLATAQALAEKSTWHAELDDLLSLPTMCDLYMVKTSDGQTFYTWSDIKRRQDPKLFNTIFEAIDPKNLQKPQTVTLRPGIRITSTQPARLPHVEVVLKLANDIRVIDESKWDTWGIDAIEQLAKRDDIEPAVQGLLLHRMARADQQIVGWALPDTYDRAAAALGRIGLDRMIWWDPNKRIDKPTNDAIMEVIHRLPPAAETKKQYLARRDELFKRLSFRPIGTAILMKNDAGAWTVFAATVSDDGVTAWAVGSPAGQQAPPMIPVAKAKAGQFTVDPAGLGDLPEGTMLFLTKQ